MPRRREFPGRNHTVSLPSLLQSALPSSDSRRSSGCQEQCRKIPEEERSRAHVCRSRRRSVLRKSLQGIAWTLPIAGHAGIACRASISSPQPWAVLSSRMTLQPTWVGVHQCDTLATRYGRTFGCIAAPMALWPRWLKIIFLSGRRADLDMSRQQDHSCSKRISILRRSAASPALAGNQ